MVLVFTLFISLISHDLKMNTLTYTYTKKEKIIPVHIEQTPNSQTGFQCNYFHIVYGAHENAGIIKLREKCGLLTIGFYHGK